MRRYIILILAAALSFSGCGKEERLQAQWEYPGPDPAIQDGPTEAHKMCYRLWQKYGLHVYWDKSGGEALRTGVGYAQESGIRSNNPDALPLQAAEEAAAVKFLTLLDKFYGLLPEEMAGRSMYRWMYLVRVNPASFEEYDEQGNQYFLNSYTEDMQGVCYFGYLDSPDDDRGDRFQSDLTGWKWNLAYTFFMGLSFDYYKRTPVFPADFSKVSAGLYYYDDPAECSYDYYRGKFNRELGKRHGLLHPWAVSRSQEDRYYPDFASYVAWILTVPLAGRSPDIGAYPKIREKYDIVIRYYKDNYDLDLEHVAASYQAVTI